MTINNEECRRNAEQAEASGDHVQAMRWYNTARAHTIGHKKRDSYNFLAAAAATKAGITFNPMNFAE